MKSSSPNRLAMSVVSLASFVLVGAPQAFAICQGVETWAQLAVLQTTSSTDLAYSPNGRRLAEATGSSVVIWNTETSQVETTLIGHAGMVRSVTWSPDGSQIASGSEDRTVRVWDVETGLNSAVLEGHTFYVGLVSWSPDGSKIASSDDETVRLWDADTGDPRRALTGFPSGMLPAVSVSWSPDGLRFATSHSSAIQIWDAETGDLLMTFPFPIADSVAWSPDGSTIAGPDVEGHFYSRIYLRDSKTGDVIRSFNPGTVVDFVSWSPDSSLLTHWSGSTWGSPSIPIWDAKSGERITELFGHDRVVSALSWSNRCDVASGAGDHTIRIWGSPP